MLCSVSLRLGLVERACSSLGFLDLITRARGSAPFSVTNRGHTHLERHMPSQPTTDGLVEELDQLVAHRRGREHAQVGEEQCDVARRRVVARRLLRAQRVGPAARRRSVGWSVGWAPCVWRSGRGLLTRRGAAGRARRRRRAPSCSRAAAGRSARAGTCARTWSTRPPRKRGACTPRPRWPSGRCPSWR